MDVFYLANELTDVSIILKYILILFGYWQSISYGVFIFPMLKLSMISISAGKILNIPQG